MTSKKDLVVAVLTTFFLTFTLFSILPSIQDGIYDYDPWADVTGEIWGVPDGKINMRDINYMILHFNKNGTPIDRDLLNITQSQIDDLQNLIDQLQAKVDSLNASLLDLEAYFLARINTLETSLIQLQAKVSELEDNLTLTETNIDNLKADFSYLNATVTSLMERINRLEGFLVNSTSSKSILTTTETQNWVDITNMSMCLTLNQTSQILIMFSTEAKVQGPSPENWTDTSITVRGLVESDVAYPGAIYLTPTVSLELGWPTTHSHDMSYSAYSYTFYMPSVAEGTYTVKLQWHITTLGSTGYIGCRTLTIMVFPC